MTNPPPRDDPPVPPAPRKKRRRSKDQLTARQEKYFAEAQRRASEMAENLLQEDPARHVAEFRRLQRHVHILEWVLVLEFLGAQLATQSPEERTRVATLLLQLGGLGMWQVVARLVQTQNLADAELLTGACVAAAAELDGIDRSVLFALLLKAANDAPPHVQAACRAGLMAMPIWGTAPTSCSEDGGAAAP